MNRNSGLHQIDRMVDKALGLDPDRPVKNPFSEVTEMRVCEIAHVVLHENQLYRFTADPDCAACQAYFGVIRKTDKQPPYTPLDEQFMD